MKDPLDRAMCITLSTFAGGLGLLLLVLAYRLLVDGFHCKGCCGL